MNCQVSIINYFVHDLAVLHQPLVTINLNLFLPLFFLKQKSTNKHLLL